MGRIPESFIADVVTRTDIVDTISDHISLKKSGSNYQACCPFHHEKTPSFNVNPTKQFYYCFGCNAHGDVISFLMNHGHLSFFEAVESLAAKLGLVVPQETSYQKNPVQNELYPALEKAADFFQKKLRDQTEGHLAIDYLKQRGLTGEICKKYQIGWAPAGWDNLQKAIGLPSKTLLESGLLIKNEQGKIYDRFRERIMFPIRDKRKRVIAFGGRTLGDGQPKYLNSPETSVFHKGQQLYGLYEALQRSGKPNFLVVVEGYMDVVALSQFGITEVVATLGTAVTTAHCAALFKVTSEVIFCFDGDEAGKRAAIRALENAMPHAYNNHVIKFIFLPKGEDPDSLVRRSGKSAFIDLIKKAIPLSDFLFHYLQKNLNMTTMEGRAQLVNAIKPYLRAVPQGAFYTLLLERLSQLVFMEKEQCERLLSENTPLTVSPSRTNQRQPLKTRPLERFLVLILHNPSFCEKWHPQRHELALPEKLNALLLKIHEQVTAQPALNTGGLLALWRETPSFEFLGNLLAKNFQLDEEQMLTEFLHLLDYFKAQKKQQKRDIQLAKLAQKALSDLSEEEKILLKQLIAGKIA